MISQPVTTTDKLMALILIAAAGVARGCINIKHQVNEFIVLKKIDKLHGSLTAESSIPH